MDQDFNVSKELNKLLKELNKLLLVMEFMNYSFSAIVIIVIIAAVMHGFN